jgi:hypothetical protein
MPQRDVNAAVMADLVGLVDQALDSQNGGDIYRHRELAGERLKSRVEGWLAHVLSEGSHRCATLCPSRTAAVPRSSRSVSGFGIEGRSRQPLLDACRELKRMGYDTGSYIGQFREGRTEADITSSVNKGAFLTVEDGPKGIRFRKYREFDRFAAGDIAEAAE